MASSPPKQPSRVAVGALIAAGIGLIFFVIMAIMVIHQGPGTSTIPISTPAQQAATATLMADATAMPNSTPKPTHTPSYGGGNPPTATKPPPTRTPIRPTPTTPPNTPQISLTRVP